MLNRVEIIGRLTENPRSGGNAPNNYCFITVAVNSYYKDRDGQKKVKSEFIPISLFGNLAALVSRYCTKGTKVFIDGAVVVRNLNTNGVRMSKVEIHAKSVIFLDKLPENQGADNDLPMED